VLPTDDPLAAIPTRKLLDFDARSRD